MDNNEGIQYIKDAAQLEKERLQNQYNASREKALGTISQEEQKLIPTYQTAREQTNVASQIGARNLAERWAQRGQTGAGIAAQAEMSRQNVLARQIGGINEQEAAAKQSFAQQRAGVETDYNTGLSDAYAKLGINTQNALREESIRQDTIARQEAIRQQDLALKQEEQAYQRQQDKISNSLAWARINQDKASSGNGMVNGSVRTFNGKTQQSIDGKWVDVKYNTVKNKKTGVDEITNKKTYEWNQKGYGLTDIKSGVSYQENGKVKNYNVWVKDNIPHIIIKDMVVPMAVEQQKAPVMNNLLESAVALKKITPEQREQILDQVEIY